MEEPPQFHGRQLTAARALASVTLAELALKAEVTVRTLHRVENGGRICIAPALRHGHVSRDVWERIVAALEKLGVKLTEDGASWMPDRRPQ